MSKRPVKIKDTLERLYEKYNHRECIKPDPLQFVYRYKKPADMEVAGLLSAALAYGRVRQIERNLNDLFSRMGASPYAFVLDFDLHTGDGNINILGDDKRFTIYNPNGRGDTEYLADVKRVLDNAPDVDIIVASAGFDEYIEDWGGNLSTEAFRKIGHLMYEFAEERCEGKRYALLEGGYNFADLGKNVLAFCEGLRGKD